QRHHNALKAGLEAMGLRFLVNEKYQLPQMNAVRCPEGVNEAEVRKTLLNEFSIEIGAGLGPLAGKIWRIGIMGYSCRPDNVMLCLSALGSVLSDMGMNVHVGDAEAAAHGAYASMHAKAAQQKQKTRAAAWSRQLSSFTTNPRLERGLLFFERLLILPERLLKSRRHSPTRLAWPSLPHPVPLRARLRPIRRSGSSPRPR